MKFYDQMTHDEILRVHAERYAQMTPQERTQQRIARERVMAAELVAERERGVRDKKLSELTFGEITDELETRAERIEKRIAGYVLGFIILILLLKYLGWWH